MNRFMGILLPSVARSSVAVRCLAALVALVLLVALLGAWAPVAMAGNVAHIGEQPFVAAGSCELRVDGFPPPLGEAPSPRSKSAAVLSNKLHSSEVPDDGTITSWRFGGSVGGAASVSLDIFGPGFSSHPELIGQFESPDKNFGPDEEDVVNAVIPVAAGDGIGATVAAPESSTESNEAFVNCVEGALDGTEDLVGFWETPLTPGDFISPKLKSGEVGISAAVELDEPIISGPPSHTSGPSAGGQTITIKGEHLAHVTGVSVGEEVATSIEQTSAHEDEEVTFVTPEALKEGNVEADLLTAGGKAKFKYDYIGAVAPTTPLVVTMEATSITSTTAVLNATVNPRGLVVSGGGECGFTYGPGEAEGEEETEIACSPSSFGGDDNEDPVSAALTGLTPDTTYGYRPFVNDPIGHKGGRGAGAELRFKTLGASGGGGGSGGGGSSGGGSSGGGGGGSSSGGGGALTKELGGTAIAPASLPLISHLVDTFVAPPAKVSKKGLLTFPLSAPGPGTFTALATIAGGAAHASSAHASIAKAKSVRYGVASVKVTQAGAVSLKISPSKAAVALLERKHRLLLHVTLTFTPTSGTATTHVVSVVVR